MSLAIQVQNLGFSYSGTQKVLQDISLEIQEGKSLGLLGINGAGKSTLISILTGHISPQLGKVSILGKNYSSNRKSILKKIALVPQGFALYPRLTVVENLDFFASLRPDLPNKDKRIQDALDFCQLDKYKNIWAQKLSGGLMRRLNLAIGIVNKPQVLFLDEPTVGIDPISKEFILSSIKELREEGMTLIYTSHQLEEVVKLCDRVAILHDGRVAYLDSLDNSENDLQKLNQVFFDVHSKSRVI